jgi:hypothetical protein
VLKANAEKKIEAVETKPSGKTKAGVEGEESGSRPAANIVAGGFVSLGLIFGGVWAARRKKRV